MLAFSKKEELCNDYVRGVYTTMELNGDLFKPDALHQNIKKARFLGAVSVP